MIINQEPTAISEIKEIIKEDNPELEKFIRNFIKLKAEDAKKMREELSALTLIKMKPEYIAKIIEFLPEDASELNKIFTETTLDEEEIKKIADIVKNYK